MTRLHQLHEMSLLVTLVNFLHVVESDLQPEKPKHDYQLSESQSQTLESQMKMFSLELLT